MIHQSGIYEILNTLNGKRYIGSAACFRRRFNLHTCQLRRNEHHNTHLQAAWNKYGEEAFKFNILLVCARDRGTLHLYEQQAFDVLQPEYNIAPIAGSLLGFKRSAETKARMSAAQKGRTVSESTKKLLADAARGTSHAKGKHLGPLSPEHCQALSAATKGKSKSAAHKAAISKGRKGMKFSAAHRKALSIAHLGKTPAWATGLPLIGEGKIGDTLKGSS